MPDVDDKMGSAGQCDVTNECTSDTGRAGSQRGRWQFIYMFVVLSCNWLWLTESDSWVCQSILVKRGCGCGCWARGKVAVAKPYLTKAVYPLVRPRPLQCARALIQ